MRVSLEKTPHMRMGLYEYHKLKVGPLPKEYDRVRVIQWIGDSIIFSVRKPRVKGAKK